MAAPTTTAYVIIWHKLIHLSLSLYIYIYMYMYVYIYIYAHTYTYTAPNSSSLRIIINKFVHYSLDGSQKSYDIRVNT